MPTRKRDVSAGRHASSRLLDRADRQRPQQKLAPPLARVVDTASWRMPFTAQSLRFGTAPWPRVAPSAGIVGTVSVGERGTPRPVVHTVKSPDGIAIQFEAAGAGDRAIVFVHGWSCDRTYWRHQVGAFANAYRVVTIDLAGHGQSGGGRGSWTMPAFGSDVVAVVDQLGLRDAVLVGHSMGGDVIVEAALVLGERVTGLVWVDTYRSLTTPESEEGIEAFVQPFRGDFVRATRSLVHDMFPASTPPHVIKSIAEDMSSAPPSVALDALRHAVGNQGPVMAALPRIRIPVVAINPDYRPTDIESLRRYGVDTVIATRVGHFPMIEDPNQFNRLLGEVITTRM